MFLVLNATPDARRLLKLKREKDFKYRIAQKKIDFIFVFQVFWKCDT